MTSTQKNVDGCLAETRWDNQGTGVTVKNCLSGAQDSSQCDPFMATFCKQVDSEWTPAEQAAKDRICGCYTDLNPAAAALAKQYDAYVPTVCMNAACMDGCAYQDAVTTRALDRCPNLCASIIRVDPTESGYAELSDVAITQSCGNSIESNGTGYKGGTGLVPTSGDQRITKVPGLKIVGIVCGAIVLVIMGVTVFVIIRKRHQVPKSSPPSIG